MKCTNTLRILGIIAVCGATSALAEDPVYEYIDIGTLGGGNSHAVAISDAGTVIGWAETGGQRAIITNKASDQQSGIAAPNRSETHAFMWRNNGEDMVDLGTLGGRWSAARGINNWDQVVGSSLNSDGEKRAFLRTTQGMFDLTSLIRYDAQGDDNCSVAIIMVEATAISDDGRIVGCGYAFDDEDQNMHGYMLLPLPHIPEEAPSYVHVDLGLLAGATECIPHEINDNSQVVGQSGQRAFLWADGQIVALDGPPRQPVLDKDTQWPQGWIVGDSSANSINTYGTAVGWATGDSNQRTACEWSDGIRKDLPPGGNNWVSEAFHVNDQGMIVGWSGENPMDNDLPHLPPRTAMLWEGCNAYDLNLITAIPVGQGRPYVDHLAEAISINEARHIVGYARTVAGESRAFLLELISPPDWNLDGRIDSNDLVDFTQDYVIGKADYNGDGKTSGLDFVEFINAYVLPGDCK